MLHFFQLFVFSVFGACQVSTQMQKRTLLALRKSMWKELCISDLFAIRVDCERRDRLASKFSFGVLLGTILVDFGWILHEF